MPTWLSYNFHQLSKSPATSFKKRKHDRRESKDLVRIVLRGGGIIMSSFRLTNQNILFAGHGLSATSNVLPWEVGHEERGKILRHPNFQPVLKLGETVPFGEINAKCNKKVWCFPRLWERENGVAWLRFSRGGCGRFVSSDFAIPSLAIAWFGSLISYVIDIVSDRKFSGSR